MRFFASQNFLTDFDKISKKAKQYGCISASIFKEFSDKTDEEISLRGNVLALGATSVILKKRAPSCNENGKSGGFRIICIVNKDESICGLLALYPKWGAYGQESMKKAEWKDRLKSYLSDKDDELLQEMLFDTDNEVVFFQAIEE